MLVSAAEPILQVTSNSLFAFVFCNLIVLVILIDTKFGSTDYGTRDGAMPVFGAYHDVKQEEIDIVKHFSSDQIVRSSRPETQGGANLALAKVTEVCDGEMKREEENQDNIMECTRIRMRTRRRKERKLTMMRTTMSDDELRRRIEDFIAKVNKEWEAENLKERMHKLTLLNSADAQN